MSCALPLRALLLVLVAACAASPVNVNNWAGLSAAVSNPSVSAVVLQANIALQGGLTLLGRSLTVSGNASACQAPSVAAVPPSSPVDPEVRLPALDTAALLARAH